MDSYLSQKQYIESEKNYFQAAYMKLLLDEMYTGLKPILSALGWDVLTVQECGLQSKADETVAKYAFDKDLLLVTQDDLPAEIADSLGGKNVQVRQKDLAAIIVKLIKDKYHCSK